MPRETLMDTDEHGYQDEAQECAFLVRIRTNRTFGAIVETGLRQSGLAPVSWMLADRDVAVVDVYAAGEREGRALLSRVRSLVSSWAEGERWTIALRRLAREDWAESWKRFFKVEWVSKRIVVKPPWKRVAPRPGRVVVEIEPGMSFGTGQHATTRSCLRLLDELAGKNPGSLLDVGCGSGILAIAGAKLGFDPVLAVDNDPMAVRIARENARRNGVGLYPSLARTTNGARRGHWSPAFPESVQTGRASASPPCRASKGSTKKGNQVAFQVADLTTMRSSSRFDVVVANILAGVLVEHATKVVRLLRPDSRSRLILSGILTPQYVLVKTTYESLGFKELRRVRDGKWTSGCFFLAHKTGWGAATVLK